MSPDRRKHRGPHPQDCVLFSEEAEHRLQVATYEVSWLLTRGYALNGALNAVGAHHALRARQRAAVGRAACSDDALIRRRAKHLAPEQVRGRIMFLDALNVLISLEAGLSGGVLLRCRDRCLRDMSGLHGTYRLVSETRPAIAMVRQALGELDVAHVAWLVDRPVNHSERLAAIMTDAGLDWNGRWSVDRVADADIHLETVDGIVASCDSEVVDRAGAWFDLASYIVARRIPGAWVVDLGEGSPPNR